ncbi:hypothetical protein L9H26_11950 [Morganella psychrotolerans]|uniref:hypothetical protein n=1 Tax=Morganella psychrotolerans TaxID=368603 RepID=UPI001CC2DE01|nr:hypothetical protein [Morganella psychrotolerans]
MSRMWLLDPVNNFASDYPKRLSLPIISSRDYHKQQLRDGIIMRRLLSVIIFSVRFSISLSV